MHQRTALIFSKFSHHSLDVRARGMMDGDLIQQYHFLGGSNQRWSVLDSGLPEEIHSISPALTPTARLYYVMAAHSQKVIAPHHSDPTKVGQYQFEPAPTFARRQGQLWQLVPVADGEYVMKNLREGKVMRLKNQSPDEGVEAELVNYNARDLTQRWEVFYKYYAGPSAVGVIFSLNSRKCLDVPNADRGDDVIIQQHTFNGGDNQKWLFEWTGLGSPSTIRSLNSSKPLSLKNTPGQNPKVVQRGAPPSGHPWVLYPTTPYADYYYIASQYEWQATPVPVMDVIWGSRADGAQIQVHDIHGGENQVWEIWVW